MLDWEFPSSLQGRRVHQTAVVPYMISFPCQLNCTKRTNNKGKLFNVQFACKTATDSEFFHSQCDREPSPPVCIFSATQWKFNDQNQWNSQNTFFAPRLRKIPMLFSKSLRDALLHGHQKVSANSLYRGRRQFPCLIILDGSATWTSALCSSLSLSFCRLPLHHRAAQCWTLPTLNSLRHAWYRGPLCLFLKIRLGDSERDSDLITTRDGSAVERGWTRIKVSGRIENNETAESKSKITTNEHPAVASELDSFWAVERWLPWSDQMWRN